MPSTAYLILFAAALIILMQTGVTFNLYEKDAFAEERRECVPVDQHCKVDGLRCCRRRECRCDESGNNCKCIEVHHMAAVIESELIHLTQKPEVADHTERPEVDNHTERPEVDNHTERPEVDNHTERPEVDNHTAKPDFFDAAMKYLTILERLNNITVNFARNMMFG